MKDITLEELKKSLRTVTYEEAVESLTEYISTHPEDDRGYTTRGMKHWGAGNRALAINDYLAAVRLNPSSSAREALRAANEILDYRNSDLYNP